MLSDVAGLRGSALRFLAKPVYLCARGSKLGRSPCSHSVPPGRAQREPQGYAGLTIRFPPKQQSLGTPCLTLPDSHSRSNCDLKSREGVHGVQIARVPQALLLRRETFNVRSRGKRERREELMRPCYGPLFSFARAGKRGP